MENIDGKKLSKKDQEQLIETIESFALSVLSHPHFKGAKLEKYEIVLTIKGGVVDDIHLLPPGDSFPLVPLQEGEYYVTTRYEAIDTDYLFNIRMQRLLRSRDLAPVTKAIESNANRFSAKTLALYATTVSRSNRSGRRGRRRKEAETVEILAEKKHYIDGLGYNKPLRTKQEMANQKIKQTAGILPGTLRTRKSRLLDDYQNFRDSWNKIKEEDLTEK